MGSKSSNTVNSKKSYISQDDIPSYSLEEGLKIANALYENFGGRSAFAEPHQLASAVNVSPTSTNWRYLTGSALAYGLTVGGARAETITLGELGKSIVSPTKDGEDIKAKVEAALKPAICRKFFERFNRAKFPQENIGKNILETMGVPKDKVDKVLDIMKKNGYFTGIITDTKTGPYVAISVSSKSSEVANGNGSLMNGNGDDIEEDHGEAENPEFMGMPPKPAETPKPENNHVFVSHGRNTDIVKQLKELITYGKHIPVVSVENETVSKPVPEKVFDDMRKCFAGIINIEAEEELLDVAGNKKIRLNENVLIEIGAALALYGDNVILLVKEGVTLPSNLQGLYQCRYKDAKLDYEATMKVLKGMNDFKKIRQ